MEKNQAMAMMSCQIGDDLNLKLSENTQSNFDSNTLNSIQTGTYSCWDYWHHDYYPIIRESYPIYLSERAVDKGKQAFEIIKMLKDSRFLKLETVGDFIDLMDKLIKIL